MLTVALSAAERTTHHSIIGIVETFITHDEVLTLSENHIPRPRITDNTRLLFMNFDSSLRLF